MSDLRTSIDRQAREEYSAHLAADDARLAEMEVTIGQDSAAYFEAWCDRMSYAYNCAPEREVAPDAEPEPEAGL